MTSTTGTDEHPEVSEISDLTEGLLSPARTAALRAHLESCTLCADVFASLEEIRGLLGTLPGPVSMPAEIAGRIDAVLAAEALLNATPDPSVSRETPDEPTADSPSSPPDPRLLPAKPLTSPAPFHVKPRPRPRPGVSTGPPGAPAAPPAPGGVHRAVARQGPVAGPACCWARPRPLP